MKNQSKTAKEAVYGLIYEYDERDIEGILDYLTDDIIWVGTASHEELWGKEAVRKLLELDIAASPSAYDSVISDYTENQLTPDCSVVFFRLSGSQRDNPICTLNTRCTHLCIRQGDVFKIASWHCSVGTTLQDEDEYFPISFAENIIKKATKDALTNIMNRASFEEKVTAYLKEEKKGFAFILLDLDNFKFVNDHYGHQAGDKILVFVADAMKKSFGQHDLAARLGGDEFVVFVPELGEHDQIDEKIKTFFENLSETLYFNGEAYVPSASVGVYCCAENNGIDDYTQCYKNADAAMYHTKKSGKNSWSKF